MSGRTIRVLLIEDDEDDYLITRDLLSSEEGQRFSLRWASRLEQGAEYLSEGGLDVVLLDLSLPDSSGWDTLTQVQMLAPEVPVVVLTGLDDNAMGISAIRKGAQDYLSKGRIDRDRLERAIRYAVERKRTEEALKLYRDHLKDLIQRRTAELKRTNRRLEAGIAERKRTEAALRKAITRLEEHDRAKSEFVSNVSHELRTPLASMSYAVDNLLRGVVGPLPERAAAYLDMVREDGIRLGTTISDILDMTRLEQNTLVLSRVKLRLARLVERAVELERRQAEAKGLTISVEPSDGLGFVSCDPQKMERVILNVIGNALKYTAEGGRIDLAIRTDPGLPGLLILDVIDNGLGIAAEHISRVTERYYRVGQHVTGTGLGLALCKEIVELHGGAIKLASPPPGRARGTQVSMCLPVTDPPIVVAADDDEDIRRLLREQLRASGYVVRTCGNGVEALSLLRRGQPDALIVDLVMPVLGGVKTITRVKADPELRDLPVIAITGAQMDTTTREILTGFDIPALAKPWKRSDLIARLEEAVLSAQVGDLHESGKKERHQ